MEQIKVFEEKPSPFSKEHDINYSIELIFTQEQKTLLTFCLIVWHVSNVFAEFYLSQ
jgi:hypothetical protein